MIWRRSHLAILIIGVVFWVLIWFGAAAIIYWWVQGR